VHPLAGQGLNLGLADAAGLAKVIAQREYWRALGDEKLLRRYERARKADVAAMGAVTDGLHGLFAQTDGRWQALRNWGMKGFARSGLLKDWVTRQATGL
jgi:2-polyprenyl-6-methoxyphenol hydroxylase-like FAD-dependent oxidoreductase